MAKKKVKAFQLFAQGETPSSASVKALGFKASTRYSYYSEWQKLGKPSSLPDETELEIKSKGKAISELEMLVPSKPEESKGEEVESRKPEDDLEFNDIEPEEPPTKPEEESKEKPGDDGKKLPPNIVAGQGLTFAITISTKTLMLYQIAASMQEEDLTIGDFIDTCVEDTYRGRGLDLGLVKMEVNK